MRTQRHTDPGQLIHETNKTTMVKRKEKKKEWDDPKQAINNGSQVSGTRSTGKLRENRERKNTNAPTQPSALKKATECLFGSTLSPPKKKTNTARGSPYPRSTINRPSAAVPYSNPIGRWSARHFRADDSVAKAAVVKLRPRQRGNALTTPRTRLDVVVNNSLNVYTLRTFKK